MTTKQKKDKFDALLTELRLQVAQGHAIDRRLLIALVQASEDDDQIEEASRGHHASGRNGRGLGLTDYGRAILRRRPPRAAVA